MYVQAALEKDAVVCVIDDEAHDFKNYEAGNAIYAADDKSIYEFFSQIVPVFKERNDKKHKLQDQDCEEEEIFAEMSKEKPYFIFIADMKSFLQLMNNSEFQMKGFLRNIIAKGNLHHIYFFSAISLDDHQEIVGDDLYTTFTGYKTGIHFGGNMADNRMLDFGYLPYSEQTKIMAPGIGSLPGVLSDKDTSKIILPLARR